MNKLLLCVTMALLLALTATAALAVSAGDRVTLGVYPQAADGTPVPLTWRVLDVRGEEALIIHRAGDRRHGFRLRQRGLLGKQQPADVDERRLHGQRLFGGGAPVAGGP